MSPYEDERTFVVLAVVVGIFPLLIVALSVLLE
jgi:nitrate reductase NapE component